MTSYLSHNYRKDNSQLHTPQLGRKKIKHFSYNPQDRIGKGYSSVVYRGSNDQTNETVAIKAIDMKGVKDSVSREMLDCEIQALTKLKHPNILKCYDVVRESSHCYIITEYCNQGDLSSLLKRKKRLSEDQVRPIMHNVIDGFLQIGEKNFLHRDLKLANIFMNDGNALIADFGFAKRNSTAAEKQKYNVGSPLYMSPEALKKNIYSIKNDIWSIGIMVYELLHGETPWECCTEKELMDKMTRVPVKFRESLNLSADIKNFIKKCLEVNEQNRMSLAGLKEWSQSCKPRPSQLIKKFSQQETNRPLSQLTNRQPSRSFSNVPLPANSKPNRTIQDMPVASKAIPLTKHEIEHNNSIVIIEINTFRLLFKIVQKLKQHCSEEKELINVLSNEVIRRVTNLFSALCPEQNENCNTKHSVNYNLKNLQSYISERLNMGIKKYKSVVKQYHNKYNNEIKLAALNRTIGPRELLKDTLKRVGFMSDKTSQEQVTMCYWMLEFTQLGKDVRKEQLDSIIEPKRMQLTWEMLSQRVQDL